MKVSDILEKKGRQVACAAPDDAIPAIAHRLVQERIGCLVIQGPDRAIVGILSERDLVHALARYGAETVDMKAADLMSTEVLTCRSDDRMLRVMAMMSDRRVRHLPVVDDGALIGIISIGDAVKHRLEEVETEAKILRDYVNAT